MFWQNGGKYTTDRAPGFQLQLQTRSLIETGEETSSEKKTGAYRYNKKIYDPENQHQNPEKLSLEHHTFPLNGPPFHGRVVNVGLGCNSPLSPSENSTSLKGDPEVESQMNWI